MKTYNRIILFPIFLIAQTLTGQTDSTADAFSLSGYVDVYGAYYTDSMPVGVYQRFPTVSPYSGQLGLNIAQLSAKYGGSHVRATVTLHYGDIPGSAWSANYNFIQEANAGFRICNKLWLDGGFFRTHVGAEGLYPKENIASSISIPTFFEPYYEAGLRLNYQPTDQFTLNAYLLNGYNMFNDNNKKKSGGLLVVYVFSDQLNIGYTNYFGDDSPSGDSITHSHWYNNAYLNYEKGKFKLTTGLDFCIQQNSDLEDPEKSATMFSGLLAARYAVCKNTNFYVRGELFNDPNGFLSGTFLNDELEVTGLELWGATLGVEHKPTANSYIRLEGRNLQADDGQKIFYWNGESTNSRLELLLNLGVWFE